MDRLPFFVAGAGDGFDVLVGQVLEAALTAQVVLHGREGLRLMVEGECAIFVFCQIPQAAVYDFLRDLHRFICRDSPAGGAGGDDVDVLGSSDLRCLFHLAHEVVQIADAGSCGVGDAVSGNDLEHVFLRSEIAADVFACRRRGGFGAEGGQRAFLDAGVHVGFVVVADVQDVVIAVDGAREGLDADIRRAAVAGEADRVEIGDALRPQAGFNAGEHGGSSREGGDDGIAAEAELGEVEAHRRHTSRRQDGHRTLTQHLERDAHREAAAAAGAGLVAVEEFVFVQGSRSYAHASSPPIPRNCMLDLSCFNSAKMRAISSAEMFLPPSPPM